MIGCNLLDAVPCDVKAKYLKLQQKQNFFQTLAASVVYWNYWEIRHLTSKDCAPIVKYIGKRQVDKCEWKIGTDNCTW